MSNSLFTFATVNKTNNVMRLEGNLFISKTLDNMVNTNSHILKGEFGKEIEEYCSQHSKDGDGKYIEFSQVPFHCSYEIAVDVIEKTVEYIKKRINENE